MSLFIPDARLEHPDLIGKRRICTAGVRVDLSHPLADGLLWASVVRHAGVSVTHSLDNLINDESAAFVNTNTDHIIYLGEQALISSTAEYPTIGIRQSDYWHFTVAAGYACKTPIADIGLYNVGSQDPVIWLDYTAASHRVGVYGGTGAAVYSSTTHVLTNSRLDVCVRMFSSGGSPFFQSAVNGKVESISSAFSDGFVAGPIQIGNSGKPGLYLQQRLLYWYLWGRSLSAEAARSITLDPYQFLIPG